jgi:hypothetical protein
MKHHQQKGREIVSCVAAKSRRGGQLELTRNVELGRVVLQGLANEFTVNELEACLYNVAPPKMANDG